MRISQEKFVYHIVASSAIFLDIKIFAGLGVTDLVFWIGLFLFLFQEKKLVTIAKLNALFFMLFVSYIAAYFLSDLWNNNVSSGYVNIAKLVTIGLIAMSTYYFRKESRSFLPQFLLFYCMGRLLYVHFLDANHYSFYQHGYWRYGVGEAVSLALVSTTIFLKGIWKVVPLILVSVLNIIFDYRGLAILPFVMLFYYYLIYMRDTSLFKKIVSAVIVLVLFVGFGVLYSYSGTIVNERRNTSNMVRAAMVYVIANDFFESGVLGHGFDTFDNKFRVPSVGNEFIENSKVSIHGYLLAASYESGKVGVIFYIAYFLCVFHLFWVRLKKGGADSLIIADFFIILYSVYCSFMQTLFEFDRYILGISIGLVFYYLSIERSKRVRSHVY